MRLLAATPLNSYEQWVALNLADRNPGDDNALIGAVGDGLVVTEIDAVSILDALGVVGLLHRVDDAWRPSPAGAGLLSRERERVAAATAHLLDGIAEADLVTAVRVLDQVRARAQDERSRMA